MQTLATCMVEQLPEPAFEAAVTDLASGGEPLALLLTGCRTRRREEGPLRDAEAVLERLHALRLTGSEPPVLLAALWHLVPLLDVAAFQKHASTAIGLADELARSCRHPLLVAVPDILAIRWSRLQRQDLAGQDMAGLYARLISHHDVCQLAWRGLAAPLIQRHEELAIPLGKHPETFWTRTRLINAVETCRVAEAASILEEIEDLPEQVEGISQHEVLYTTLMSWLSNAVLANRRVGRHAIDDMGIDWQELKGYRPGIDTLLGVFFGDQEELRSLLPGVRSHGLTLSNMFGYTGVRAALGLGLIIEAREQLVERRQGLAATWLDDLFWSRIYLLEGDRRRAVQCFRRALECSHRYGAENRLQFELALSRELTPLDLFDLGRQAGGSVNEVDEARNSPHVVVEAGGESDQDERSIGLVGSSRQMQRVQKQLALYAASDAPVLITGETGTGKELVARALHQRSPRWEAPFVAINCAGITDSLLEAELFGHRKGAFTGADADHPGLVALAGRGTLFLDEIGEASQRFQAALLRLLESGEYRAVGGTVLGRMECRVVAATNLLAADWRSGRAGRSDLFYRLERLSIELPPLRERRGDIPELVRHFLAGVHPAGLAVGIAEGLLATMVGYDWPGNVRQLRNEVEMLFLHFPNRRHYDIDDWRSVSSLVLDGQGRTTSRMIHRRESTVRLVQETEAARSRQAARVGSVPAPSDQPGTVGAQPDGGERPVAPASGEAAAGAPLLGTHQQRRRVALEGYFRRHRQLTRKDIVTLLGIAPMTAAKDLERLCRDGLIERVEPTASPATHFFRLCEARP